MKSSFSIGTIRGIKIEINISWFIIFAIITWSLASSFYPASYPNMDLATRILLGAGVSILFFVSVLLHELSHSFVSLSLKIPVKKITLVIFGGLAEIEKEPDTPSKELKIAIAGPAMSLLLYVLFTLLAILLQNLNVLDVIITSISYLALVNLTLGIFNLIPAFPLDGGRVLRSLIWRFSGDLHKATKIASTSGKVFGYLLIIAGVFTMLNNYFFNGIWLIFIGWLIHQMSQSNYQSMVVANIFDNIPVREFMNVNTVTVDATISIHEAINEYFLKYKYTVFPVWNQGHVIGILSADNVKVIPRESQHQTKVESILTPISPALTVTPDETVSAALKKILSNGIGRVLVMNGDDMLGIISKTDVLNYLALYKQLHNQ